MSQQKKILEFRNITGADEQQSRRFLQSANFNVELALSQYFDQGMEQEFFVPPEDINPPVMIQPEPEPMPLPEPIFIDKPIAQVVTSNNNIVPLRGMKIKSTVQDLLADVKIQMRFENDSDSPIEATFKYVQESSTVYDFKIKVGEKTLVAKCQTKKEALETYDDGISSGYGGFLLEQGKHEDTFTLSIGNMLPKTSCELEINYVQELEMKNDAVQFALPITHSISSAVSKFDNKSDIKDGLELEVNLAMKEMIDTVNCESNHPIKFEVDNKNAKVTSEMNHKDKILFRPFSLLVKTIANNVPRALIEKSSKKLPKYEHSVLCSFFPKINEEDVDEVLGELIFLIDRSGSMAGSRMKQVQNSLQIFLRSLPIGTKFNLVSFGDKFESLFPSSREYDNNSFQVAIQHVNKMEANMGGTKILPALKFVLENPVDPKYPRQVFLLTDGDVDNTDEILSFVKKNTFSSRIFTFGLGMDASKRLVIGIAKAGKGKAEFITESSQCQKIVMSQLTFALQPTLKNITIEWGDLKVTQTPSKIDTLFSGERIILYGLVEQFDKNVVYPVKLTAYVGDKKLNFPLSLDFNDLKEGETVHRLSTRSLIRDIEKGYTKMNKEEAAELAVNFGIVSKYTSLVAVEERDEIVEGTMLSVDVNLSNENERHKQSEENAPNLHAQFKGDLKDELKFHYEEPVDESSDEEEDQVIRKPIDQPIYNLLEVNDRKEVEKRNVNIMKPQPRITTNFNNNNNRNNNVPLIGGLQQPIQPQPLSRPGSLQQHQQQPPQMQQQLPQKVSYNQPPPPSPSSSFSFFGSSSPPPPPPSNSNDFTGFTFQPNPIPTNSSYQMENLLAQQDLQLDNLSSQLSSLKDKSSSIGRELNNNDELLMNLNMQSESLDQESVSFSKKSSNTGGGGFFSNFSNKISEIFSSKPSTTERSSSTSISPKSSSKVNNSLPNRGMMRKKESESVSESRRSERRSSVEKDKKQAPMSLKNKSKKKESVNRSRVEENKESEKEEIFDCMEDEDDECGVMEECESFPEEESKSSGFSFMESKSEGNRFISNVDLFDEPTVQVNSTMRPIDTILQHQNFNGVWVPNNNLLSLLKFKGKSYNPKQFSETIPSSLSSLSEEIKGQIWISIILTCYIPVNFEKEKSECEMMLKKAIKYIKQILNKNNLSNLYDSLVEQAKNFV